MATTFWMTTISGWILTVGALIWFAYYKGRRDERRQTGERCLKVANALVGELHGRFPMGKLASMTETEMRQHIHLCGTVQGWLASASLVVDCYEGLKKHTRQMNMAEGTGGDGDDANVETVGDGTGPVGRDGRDGTDGRGADAEA